MGGRKREDRPSDVPVWTCPINISGLNRRCIVQHVNHDLTSVLGALCTEADGNVIEPIQIHRDRGPLHYARLHGIIEHRVSNLSRFFRQAAMAIEANHFMKSEAPLAFSSMAGDSHHGGIRPLKLFPKSGPIVLKFAEPRAYLLLKTVVERLSHDIGAPLDMPSIVADSANRWYFIPFLDARRPDHMDAERFMFTVAALTAVAFALRLVDLHMENVLIHEGHPIIIDPECILSNFSQMSDKERLLSTGLLSHRPELSSLRGGGPTNPNVFEIGFHRTRQGTVSYRKPAPSFSNRLCDRAGRPLDPASFRKPFFAGYLNAMRWFSNHADDAIDMIKIWVPDDFRIRYLVRKTRSYSVTHHMLNLPVGDRYDDWRDSVLFRFSRSGHSNRSITPALLNAEVSDLDQRDIPYFWVCAGERVIRHQTGVVQGLGARLRARFRSS